ncbi:MAG TPA: HK97 family phage prohead protease [Acetobacteraceae bacterium]|nr:HK97 family phage prohead protease [Acetobacteraceae bacterium]
MIARFPDGVELRTAETELRSTGRTLLGHAAVWDRPTLIGGRGGFTEVVKRGAFAAHLATGADVFLLAHHDFAQPLARTGNGSLQLREDDKGLAFEAVLPQTRAADDILELARAGTIAGSSFAFRVPPGGDAWPSRDRRELRAVELVEVSAVTAPAYAETTISARARPGGSTGMLPLGLRLIMAGL